MPDQNLCTFSDFLVVANMLNIAIIFFNYLPGVGGLQVYFMVFSFFLRVTRDPWPPPLVVLSLPTTMRVSGKEGDRNLLFSVRFSTVLHAPLSFTRPLPSPTTLTFP